MSYLDDPKVNPYGYTLAEVGSGAVGAYPDAKSPTGWSLQPARLVSAQTGMETQAFTGDLQPITGEYIITDPATKETITIADPLQSVKDPEAYEIAVEDALKQNQPPPKPEGVEEAKPFPTVIVLAGLFSAIAGLIFLGRRK